MADVPERAGPIARVAQNRYAKFLLRAVVSGGLLYAVAHGFDLQELRDRVVGADASLLALVVLLFTADRILMAAKWGYLLDMARSGLRFWRRVHLYYVSGVIGLGLPLGGFGPDVVRVVIARKDPSGMGAILLSVLAERIHGTAATVAMGVLAFLVYVSLEPDGVLEGVPPVAIYLFAAAALLGSVLLSASALFPEGYRKVARYVRRPEVLRRLATKLVDLSHALGEGWRRRNLLFLFWTFVEQLFGIAGIYLAARSLGVEIGLLEALAVVPVGALMMRIVPFSFAGLGVTEVTYAVLFAALGVPVVDAVSVSLVTFCMFLVSMLPGFVLLLSDIRSARTNADAGESEGCGDAR